MDNLFECINESMALNFSCWDKQRTYTDSSKSLHRVGVDVNYATVMGYGKGALMA